MACVMLYSNSLIESVMPITLVNSQTLNRWLDSGEACLIDVREPAEHAAERIAAAALVPLSVVCAERLPKSAGKKLVVHCLKGGRGATACEKLLAENPELEISRQSHRLRVVSALLCALCVKT